jgi:DNA (cytosine-5)-methyltransferase 1
MTIADLFCGAGGTSAGAVEAISALGHRPKLTAINHWPVAIATHQQNHPDARHLTTSIDNINPRDLFSEGELDLLWASPECTHHSVARGGRPINDQSRATAWCVVRWAEALRPNVILVENVPEFISWGGIGANGRPLAGKKGATFLAWKGALESLGYRVDHRILCAADYGDPTTRRRLFVQAVRGKRKICWPNATHATKQGADLFAARLPWVPARDVIDWNLPGESIYDRKKPLSDKTLRRIFEGLKKFGLDPSLVCMEHGGSVKSMDLPVPTITTAKGGAMGVATPFLIQMRGTSDAHVDGSARSLEDPLGTVSAGGRHHALIEPYMIKVNHGTGSRIYPISRPVPTVAGHRGEVALIEPSLLPQQSDGVLRAVSEPVPTISTAGAIALIEPYLIEYYGNGGSKSVDEPLGTATTKQRFGLARPEIIIRGHRYLIDIRFRMLQPGELACAQGFPAGYQFSGTKTDVVKQIGNAVPRHLARSIVYAVVNQDPDVRALWN